MIQQTRAAIFLLSALMGTGCASMPESRLQYYLPKADVKFGAVITLACTDENKIKSNMTPTISAETKADYSATQEIHLEDFNNAFGTASIKIGWYDDGRLKSINSESTGGGKEILETAVKLASTVATSSFMKDDTLTSQDEVCQQITKEKTKSLSFIYQSAAQYSSDTFSDAPNSIEDIQLMLSSESNKLRLNFNLKEDFVPIQLISAASYSSNSRVAHKTPEKPSGNETICSPKSPKPNRSIQGIPICIRDTLHLELAFNPTYKSPNKATKVISGLGNSTIYIPKPPAFGGQTFSLTLAENGSLTSLGYGLTGGATQATGSFNSLMTALSGPTDIERAANLKAKGDIIANQQRYLCLEEGAGDC